jgi:hypothetical protein
MPVPTSRALTPSRNRTLTLARCYCSTSALRAVRRQRAFVRELQPATMVPSLTRPNRSRSAAPPAPPTSARAPHSRWRSAAPAEPAPSVTLCSWALRAHTCSRSHLVCSRAAHQRRPAAILRTLASTLGRVATPPPQPRALSRPVPASTSPPGMPVRLVLRQFAARASSSRSHYLLGAARPACSRAPLGLSARAAPPRLGPPAARLRALALAWAARRQRPRALAPRRSGRRLPARRHLPRATAPPAHAHAWAAAASRAWAALPGAT